MGCSYIKQLWDGIQALQNLKIIKLSHCQYLVEIPDLIEAINLQKLFLDGCSSLFEVHSSISALQNLHFLDLKGCKQLKILPSCIHMKSLRILRLSSCSNLEKFPEISEVMVKLKWLYLDGTAIKELPSSINNLTGIVTLDLKGCTELKTLPTGIQMSSLQTLVLVGCSNLEKFPEISGIMKELLELRLDETAIEGLPSSIDRLLGIKKLSMRNCKSLKLLPDIICNLADLTHLDLSGCSVLHKLPEKLGDLESLTCLEVLGSGIKHFPFSVCSNKKLVRYSFHECEEMLEPFSSSSSLIRYYSFSCLVHLDLSDCNLLEFSDAVAHLPSLKTLKLCRNNLECLPATMNQLGCLTHLEVKACRRLKSIPELSSISYINAQYCAALETVSTPKTDCRNLDFRFSNCFRLLQVNLFIDIVETHFVYQDYHLRPLSCNTCFPESEIPNWFSHQSRASSITVQLPPNWFDKLFLGLALCAVSCFNEADPSYAPHVAALCYCTFKGNQGDHNFSFICKIADSWSQITCSWNTYHGLNLAWLKKESR
ncbi:putative leucine-rich repeat domain, L domain-containing protein [Rosa chinensis]|uniref:Putative leucine-rich repeat domain, L domain-containing protein n=1 Tax=Rosa chinensis TaxID=74649 RepID=A0A2P6PQS3_ROSCH|nr:putative leucine-rich repeat domain, L domain-containing protein [Rosa chinensis]